MSDLNIKTEAAKAYQAKGYFITPADGKAPKTKGWQKREDHFSDDEIESTWRNGQKNIAIVTGEKSNLLVIDVDVKGESNGLETIKRLEEENEPLSTRTVSTPSGGVHYYYQFPRFCQVRNKVEVLKGIDIRANAGCVIAPPSSVNGKAYKLVNDIEPQEMPEWLIRLISDDDSYKGMDEKNAALADEIEMPKEVVSEGGRNDTLFRYGCSLRSKGVSEKIIGERLHHFNENKCSPPLKNAELQTIIASVMRYDEGLGTSSITDLDNSRRFVTRWKNDVRFSPDDKYWYIWNTKRWRKDEAKEILNHAKDIADDIMKQASEVEDDRERNRCMALANKARSKYSLTAMVDLAQPNLWRSRTRFDLDDYAINMKNGVFDLKKFELLAHEDCKGAFHSKLSSVSYDENAECPTFEKFLNTTFAGDEELIRYVQEVLGYCLTGDTTEHCFFILLGEGRNGKSTLLNMFNELVGDDYHRTADIRSFLQGNQNSIRSDLARLQGARIVTASEPNEGQYLNEGTIKNITGGEKTTARELYANEVEFTPQYKLLLAANHMPRIEGQDLGIKRRIRIIPFDHIIPPDEVDARLGEKLKAELPGIFNWALAGLRRWHENDGLTTPKIVEKRLEEQLVSMDTLQLYLNERCKVSTECCVPCVDFHAAYGRWCEEAGERVQNKKRIAEALDRKGIYRAKKRIGGILLWRYHGVTFAEAGDEDRYDLEHCVF